MRRFTAALIAAFSALLLTVTVAPIAANAQDTKADVVSNVDRKPARPVSANIKQTKSLPGAVRVKIWGKAKAHKRKNVILQKKRGGKWAKVQVTKTNKATKYVFYMRLPVGTHRLRVKVPAGNGYKLSYSKVIGGTVS